LEKEGAGEEFEKTSTRRLSQATVVCHGVVSRWRATVV